MLNSFHPVSPFLHLPIRNKPFTPSPSALSTQCSYFKGLDVQKLPLRYRIVQIRVKSGISYTKETTLRLEYTTI
jgi:hypothetical protein